MEFEEIGTDPFAGQAGQAQQSLIDIALKEEGVDGPLAQVVKSIYEQESGSGKNTKTSNRGAEGGMQVLPATFYRMADKNWSRKDPIHNARAGVRYLKHLHNRTPGNLHAVAAGYYGGEGGQDAYLQGKSRRDSKNPNYPDTFEYSNKVMSRVNLEWEEVGPDDQANAPQTASEAPEGFELVGDDTTPQQPQQTAPAASKPVPAAQPEATPKNPSIGTKVINALKPKEDKNGNIIQEVVNNPIESAKQFGKGLLQGGRDVLAGVGQLGANAIVGGLNAVGATDTAKKAEKNLQEFNNKYDASEKKYQEETPDSDVAGLGRVIPNVIPVGPSAVNVVTKATKVGKATNAAAAGALAGTLQPVQNANEDFAEKKAWQAGTGAVVGAAAGPVVRAGVKTAAALGSKKADDLLTQEVVRENFSGPTAKLDAEIVRDLAERKAEYGSKLTATEVGRVQQSYLNTMGIQLKAAGLKDKNVQEVLANARTPERIDATVRAQLEGTEAGRAILANIAKYNRVSQLTPAVEASGGLSGLLRAGIDSGFIDGAIAAKTGLPVAWSTRFRQGVMKHLGGRQHRWETAEKAVKERNVKAADWVLRNQGPSDATKGMSILRQLADEREQGILRDKELKQQEILNNRELKEQRKIDAQNESQMKKDIKAREKREKEAEAARKKAEDERAKRQDISGTPIVKSINAARKDLDNAAMDSVEMQINGGGIDLVGALRRQVPANSELDKLASKVKNETDEKAADAWAARQQLAPLEQRATPLPDDSPIGQLLARQRQGVQDASNARMDAKPQTPADLPKRVETTPLETPSPVLQAMRETEQMGAAPMDGATALKTAKDNLKATSRKNRLAARRERMAKERQTKVTAPAPQAAAQAAPVQTQAVVQPQVEVSPLAQAMQVQAMEQVKKQGVRKFIRDEGELSNEQYDALYQRYADQYPEFSEWEKAGKIPEELWEAYKKDARAINGVKPKYSNAAETKKAKGASRIDSMYDAAEERIRADLSPEANKAAAIVLDVFRNRGTTTGMATRQEAYDRAVAKFPELEDHLFHLLNPNKK